MRTAALSAWARPGGLRVTVLTADAGARHDRRPDAGLPSTIPCLFVLPTVVQHERTAFAHSITDVRDIVSGGDAIRCELDPFEGVEFELVVEQPHPVAENDRGDV